MVWSPRGKSHYYDGGSYSKGVWFFIVLRISAFLNTHLKPKLNPRMLLVVEYISNAVFLNFESRQHPLNILLLLFSSPLTFILYFPDNKLFATLLFCFLLNNLCLHSTLWSLTVQLFL